MEKVVLRTVYTKTERIGLGCSFEENGKETKRVASVWFAAYTHTESERERVIEK